MKRRELIQETQRQSFDLLPSSVEAKGLDKSLISQLYGKGLTTKQLLSEQILVQSVGSQLRVSNAALLVFGKKPEQSIPEAKILCSEFKGTSGREIISTREITGSIPYQAQQAMSLISSWLERNYKLRGVEFRGTTLIPEVALREAIINALVHRKYSIPGAIKIALFQDRLEIFSPGALPGFINLNNLGDGTTYLRNPLIVKFCRKLRLLETLGTGIRMIFESCKKKKLRKPEYREDGDFVKLIFYFEKMKVKKNIKAG